MAGWFITMEGPDGSGKTTQIQLLKQELQKQGYEVLVTREPGGTSIGEQIRKVILDVNNVAMDPMTEAILYAAARAQHVKELIQPALEQNKIVLCDRFLDSSIAYQGVARGLGMDMVEGLNHYATGGLNPDITFFIDMDPVMGLQRKKNQAQLDRLEKETLDFHQKVYKGYLALWKKYPDRIHRISGDDQVESIHQQIMSKVKERIKRGLSYEYEINHGCHS
ncbi:MAG: dTMP kinase [Epulopiscium sp.]|nr:dTMP kinase [Candidatus Epulonipiscium sp.]